MQGDGVTIRDSIGREQHPTIINESGLYSLVRISGTLRTFLSMGILGKTPSKRANYPNYPLSPKYRKYPNYPNQNPRPSQSGRAGAVCLTFMRIVRIMEMGGVKR